MTPAQQSALEAIAERPLKPGEIVAIDALLPMRNDVQIAAILSADRVAVLPTPIGIGTVLAVMKPSGGAFLRTLQQIAQTDPPTDTSSNVFWALEMIKQGTFDVGHPDTRDQLADFAFEQPQLAGAVSALLDVAEKPDPLHFNIVSDALNVAEGRLTLSGV